MPQQRPQEPIFLRRLLWEDVLSRVRAKRINALEAEKRRTPAAMVDQVDEVDHDFGGA